MGKSKIDYINEAIRNQGRFYNGPKSLFKYRPFDSYTFDMLENDYVYLCPAKRLDDETECDTSLDLNRLMDLETNNLKRECVDQIIEMIKPYVSQENYQLVKSKIYSITNSDGTVKPNFMLDVAMELQELLPKGFNIAPFVNWIVNVPERLDNPTVKPQMERLISIGINAKDEIGICSLCESPDVDDMWNDYADKDSGYCIEYDVSGYEFNKCVFPVVYDDNRETNLIIQLVANFIGQMITGMSNGEIQADQSQFIRLFLTKNTEWQHQKEWRLIGEADGKPMAPKIKRIYIGKRAKEESRKKLKEYCERHSIEIVER